MKGRNDKNVWTTRLDSLYERLYNPDGTEWASDDAYARKQGLYTSLGYDGQNTIKHLIRCTELFTSLSDSKRKYDKEASEAMLRLTEPVLRGFYEIINTLGTNMHTAKLRKSVPSKSRLHRIYSQYSEYNLFRYAPHDYTIWVADKEDPMAYERAYYLMAIKSHGEETTAQHVKDARDNVHDYIHRSWARNNVRNQAKRNRYSYKLHPDLEAPISP